MYVCLCVCVPGGGGGFEKLARSREKAKNMVVARRYVPLRFKVWSFRFGRFGRFGLFACFGRFVSMFRVLVHA